jgi:glycerol uptake facilitator-like aquaporin
MVDEPEIERLIAPWLGRLIAAVLTGLLTFLAARLGQDSLDLSWVAGAGATIGALLAGFVARKIDWAWHKATGKV